MRHREHGWTKDDNQDGFTVVEFLFSFLLILAALVFMAHAIVFSMDGLHRSRLRFEMSQRLEECKDRLLSAPFDAEELREGHGTERTGPFKITRDIAAVSTTLKYITVSVSYKTFTKKTSFYKSRYIKEIKNG